MIALKIFRRDFQHPEIMKFERFPVTIGRSVRNDIILQDETISAQHCQLYKDERGYFLKDLGSTNAFYSRGVRLTEFQVINRSVVWVGDIKIEFLFDDDDLDKTREIIYRPDFLNQSIGLGSQGKHLLLPLLGLALVNGFSYYSDKAIAPQLSELFSNLLSMLLIAAVLSLFVSFLSKLHSKNYHFLSIFRNILLTVTFYQCLELVNDFIIFNLYYSWLATAVSLLLSAAVFYWLTRSLMRVVLDRLSKQKIHHYSIAIVFSFFSVMAIFDFLSSIESSNFTYYGAVSYPLTSFSQQKNGMNELNQKLQDTYQRIEKHRLQALKNL